MAHAQMLLDKLRRALKGHGAHGIHGLARKFRIMDDDGSKTLSFAEAAGQVDTASIAQVRKPLYNSSVGEWRRHEQYLRPLLEALDAHGAVYAI